MPNRIYKNNPIQFRFWTLGESLQDSDVKDNTIKAIPQQPIKGYLANPPIYQGSSEAIKQKKYNSTCDPDRIPAEIYKNVKISSHHLHIVINGIWKQEQISSDFRHARIVSIFRKGDGSDCSSYSGISLLSIDGKIFAHIPLNRLPPLIEEILPGSQCGFGPLRGATEITFVARQLQ